MTEDRNFPDRRVQRASPVAFVPRPHSTEGRVSLGVPLPLLPPPPQGQATACLVVLWNPSLKRLRQKKFSPFPSPQRVARVWKTCRNPKTSYKVAFPRYRDTNTPNFMNQVNLISMWFFIMYGHYQQIFPMWRTMFCPKSTRPTNTKGALA